MKRLDLVDRQNAGIDVWVKRVPRERHHIWTAFHIDLILPSTEIISCVIHRHCVTLFKAIAGDENFVAFSICEGWRLCLVLAVEDASEKVIPEVWDEVLWWVNKQPKEAMWRPAFRAGSFPCSPRAHW